MISSKIRVLRNNKIWLLGLLLIITRQAEACDICGCFMGITPYDSQSSIAMLYRYRTFHGYNGQTHKLFPNGSKFLFPQNYRAALPEHSGNPADFETYRTAEIRGRFFINPKVELNAIVPYNSNTASYSGQTASVSGIGDINMFAGYHLLNKISSGGFSQRLIGGLGIKLPTGKFSVSDLTGTRYSTLHQPGTGSTDGFIYANYLMAYKKLGLSLNSSYKINGENKYNEGIANSTTSFLNLFYMADLGNSVKLIPSLQTFYEYSGGETYKGEKTGEHESNNLMNGLGMDIFYKNIALNSSIQWNTLSVKTDHPLSAGKIMLGITYNFKNL